MLYYNYLRILILIFFTPVFLSVSSFAQPCEGFGIQFQTCNPVILFQTTVIDQNTTINDMSGGCYWVCPGVVFDCAGVNSEIYAEPGSTINLNGGAENVIFMHATGTINIGVAATFNWVRRSPTVVLVDQGAATQDSICPVSFIYPIVLPIGACLTTGIIDAQNTDELISYYSHEKSLHLSLKDKSIISEKINIYDSSGRRCYSESLVLSAHDASIDLSELSNGIYFTEIVTEQMTFGFKFLLK